MKFGYAIAMFPMLQHHSNSSRAHLVLRLDFFMSQGPTGNLKPEPHRSRLLRTMSPI